MNLGNRFSTKEQLRFCPTVVNSLKMTDMSIRLNLVRAIQEAILARRFDANRYCCKTIQILRFIVALCLS